VGGRLTLFFELPLNVPIEGREPATISVFDPEYFVSFEFDGNDPVTLVGAPPNCHTSFRPARPDAQMLVTLGAVPADQRGLSADLKAAVAGWANVITLTCE
jgi:ABC-type uncharacterized transport system substrate-binding protein